MRGECVRGEFCKFSHDFKPAIAGPPAGSTSGGFGGSPPGGFLPLPPMGSGREMCGDFSRGVCRRGDRCKYMHGNAPQMPPMGPMGMPPMGPMGLPMLGMPMMGPGGPMGMPPMGMPPMGMPPMMGPPGMPMPGMGPGMPGHWGAQPLPHQGASARQQSPPRVNSPPANEREKVPIDYDEL